MTSLTTIGNTTTMTSLELLDLINQQRTEFGEVEVRRNHFHDRVRDELEGENYQSFVVTNPNGTQSEAFHLSLDQCMLVAMRESKGVRRQVQAKLRDVQAPVLALPQDYIQALESLLASKKSEQVALAQLAIAAPKAEALDLLTLADGAMCITNAAKAVSKQPKALFAWLQAHDWIYRRPGGVWCAYQPRIKSGFLTHKVTTVSRSDGTEKIVEQVLVTAKGLVKLAVVFGEVTA